jgi:hypothetical protein
VLAEAELERNRARLIAEAEEIIATSPLFARYRVGANLRSDAQCQALLHNNNLCAELMTEMEGLSMIVGYGRVCTESATSSPT